jgi:hypothetical protein
VEKIMRTHFWHNRMNITSIHTVSSKASRLLLPLSCFSRRSLRIEASARTRGGAEEEEEGPVGGDNDDDAGTDIPSM